MLVIKNKYGKWNTPCSTKVDGSEVTYWLSVGWGKGKEPTQDKLKIKVNESFYGAFLNKDKVPQPKLIIMSWEYEQEVKKADDGYKYVEEDFNNTPSLEVAPSDLPFY